MFIEISVLINKMYISEVAIVSLTLKRIFVTKRTKQRNKIMLSPSVLFSNNFIQFSEQLVADFSVVQVHLFLLRRSYSFLSLYKSQAIC